MEAEEKPKKKNAKKTEVEINPELETNAQALRVEGLSRMGRIRLARSMKRASKSGKLSRGKRRKKSMAMTMGRATKLGWRGARRDIKQGLSGGKSTSQLTAAQRSRVEKIADKRKDRQRAISKIKRRAILTQSFDMTNFAFEMMLEGKRYHNLLNKEGSVKFDMRFKHFKNAPKPDMPIKEAVKVMSEMYDVVMTTQDASNINVMVNASVIALSKLAESDTSKSLQHHALSVSKTFGVDVDTILGKYNEH